MAGYYGYSMSNNAVDAYDNGEKPKSKWTKTAMLDAIKEMFEEGEVSNENVSFEKIKSMPKDVIFDCFFEYSSWHHTSSKFNRTDFYSLSLSALNRYSDDELTEFVKAAKETKSKQNQEKKEETPQGKYLCSFDYWYGSRKHPKCERVTVEGEIKGKRFYSRGYGVKNLSTSGFEIIKKLD